MEQGKSKKEEFLGNLLLLFITIAIFFIFLEIAIRIIKPDRAETTPGLIVKDELLGFKQAPNFTAKHINTNSEFAVTITTNSLGLRSREIEKEKTRKRVLVLGDSVVWGFGVEDNETFASILNEETGGFEFINAALSDYSTRQELDYLKRDGIKLEPDVVMLGFFVGNDFVDNLVRSGNASMKVESSWFKNLKRGVRKNIKTYDFLMSRLRGIYQIRMFLVKTGLANNEDFYQYRIYMKDYDNDVNQAVNITFSYIDEMNSLAKKENVTFVMVLIPPKYQIYDKEWESALAYNRFKADDVERTKPTIILKDFCRKNNITCIDLLDDLQSIKEDMYLTKDTSHFNALGHRIIANILKDKFKNQSL